MQKETFDIKPNNVSAGDKLPISIVIIAKNEEKRLPDCLESVKWAQDIIVVDDDSTDKTVEIAQSYGARVFRRKMENEGRHRNFANAQAVCDWIVSLDADERISPELKSSLEKMLAGSASDKNICYDACLRYFLGDEWIRGASYYPSWRTRIFRRGRLMFKEERVHPPVKYDGSCGKLHGDIIHYSWPHWHAFFDKMNRETKIEAQKWIEQGRVVPAREAVRKGISRFLKNYFQKSGWRYGYNGFLMSCAHAWYQLMAFAKYRELLRRPGLYD